MSRRTPHASDLPRLGTLEAQVMDVLWDHGPATVREVIDQLAGSPAYTTIATVLTNLDRKDLVTITRQARSTRYAARLSRQEHAVSLMDQVLEASRDRTASILHFVDTMPESDLALLRDYLSARGPGERS
ncbi:BlaI/MecI/CopY family transcriptional regulator [Ornithinimicrobium cavernae]|uniref:BlaI/MecI/CopY family transcriptional regulator n=1 Tax=Ornithinimicrobium cavernae TaxID=2666047 RepID=UPI000D69FF8F|nr:BlaI/MecI/CopY family transcriptional regulator [Ornithinimicrobium cavernae]